MARHGWTVDTLKEHVDSALLAQEKALAAAMKASYDAVSKAEMAAEKRFDSVNEFRAQLSDQAQTFMPRREYDVQHAALGDRVTRLDSTLGDRVTRLEADQLLDQGGQARVAAIRTVLMALAGLAIAASGFLVGLLR